MVALAFPQSSTDAPQRPDRRTAARNPFVLSKFSHDYPLTRIMREIAASQTSSQVTTATNRMGTMVPEVRVAVTGLYRQMIEFAELDEDWDSYGAKRISPKALDAARGFLESITRIVASPEIQTRIVPAWIGPLPNGGILFEWHGASADLEVEVTADGALELLLEKRVDGESEYFEQVGVGVAEIAPLLSTVMSS